MSKEALYRGKSRRYFAHVREDVIAHVPPRPNRVLDVGCASGATLAALKARGKAAETVGVDIVDVLIDSPDRFLCLDVENEDMELAENYFDVIICADILEHLVDPWTVVRKLAHLLNEGGLFISSVPNIRDFRSLISIMRGDFHYSEEGVLDKGHIRFFCLKNIVHLHRNADLKVEKVQRILRRRRKRLNRATLGIFKEFLTPQYVIVCRK
ncbi:MAG: class I SAM-dependent methyltransferase [Nitrospirota bacterium]|jgi:SAM-dependent methyltransferase